MRKESLHPPHLDLQTGSATAPASRATLARRGRWPGVFARRPPHPGRVLRNGVRRKRVLPRESPLTNAVPGVRAALAPAARGTGRSRRWRRGINKSSFRK